MQAVLADSSSLAAGCIAGSCTAWRWCTVAEGVPDPELVLFSWSVDTNIQNYPHTTTILDCVP